MMRNTLSCFIRTVFRAFGGMTCAGAVLLIAFRAVPQDLYVSDGDAGSINVFSPAGVETSFSTHFFSPYGLAFDSAGNLFVADFGYRCVFKFTPEGAQSTFVSSSQLGNPEALAFDHAGNLYVGDYGDGNIWKFTPDGTQTSFASGLTFPVGLAIDSSNDVFVTVASFTTPRVVYKFTPAGAQSTFASGLNAPGALAIDGADNLYVSDSPFIYKFAPDGNRSTFATNTYAYGLTCNKTGDLFEADGANGTIYEYTPGGVQSTFATGVIGNFLAFAPAPGLRISLVGASSVMLAWPSSFTGYALEQSPSPGATNWVFNTEATNVVNGDNQVIIGPATNKMFFRLAAP
jgi:sugar lactone lactonase YvrE